MFGAMFAGLDQPTLIAAIEQSAREEAVAGARKLAAIAQLVHSAVTFDDECDRWAYDSWAEAACELGAVLNMGQMRASAQMRIAVALRDRLPKMAELFLAGRLSARLVAEITWRTRLVDDEQVLAVLDGALAQRALRWGPLSQDRLRCAIDALIERYDPDAVIRAREVINGRDFRIGAHEDPDELVTVWGKVLGCDAVVLAARIAALLKGICADDPRSEGERRSCAVGAIIQGQDHLPCRCGSPDCTASAPPASSNVVISVIADHAAVAAARQLIATEDREQQQKHAQNQAKTEPAPEAEAEPTPEPDAEPAGDPVESAPLPVGEDESPEPGPAAGPEVANPVRCLRDSGVALLPGVKVLPIVALAEAIRAGAAIKSLWLPGPDPEPHYRPSAKLVAFVRARDLFCRYPGCGGCQMVCVSPDGRISGHGDRQGRGFAAG